MKRYQGIKIEENGDIEVQDFATYAELLRWLAESPEAGIAAYLDGEAIDQAQLQLDVEAL